MKERSKENGQADPEWGISLSEGNVLVIGGTGGIGAAIVEQLLEAGAKRIVVASAHRSVALAHPSNVVHETVDVTSRDSVVALADRLRGNNLSVVINCAGVNGNERLDGMGNDSTARREMEVNYFGLLNIGAVFAPALAAQGGGRIMTVLSFLSHVNLPLMATYCASKAAAHSLTQAFRAEWRGRGVHFCGVYPTAVDTGMSAAQVGPKQSPEDLAKEMLEALSRGDEDLFPGDAKSAYEDWLSNPKSLERAMASSVAITST